jgi:anti-anti-sigma factor
MALSIQVEEGRSFTKTMRVGGRLDDQTAGELDAELDKVLATALKTLVFDLAGLEYTTSAGLRSFLRAQKAMKQRGGETLFVNVQPPVQKVFEIAKAANLNTVFRSVRELDAYLDAMQKKAKEEAR